MACESALGGKFTLKNRFHKSKQTASEIKELFFYSPSGERIKIPISKTIVSHFVRDKIICNPIKLEPIYPLHLPVVYRIYLDDGCCASEHCTNNHHFRQLISPPI